VYVRFGGEFLETYHSNVARRRVLSLRLKAQYIWHLAGSVVGVLVVYGVMHLLGVNDYLGLPVALGLGGLLVVRVYRMSKRYGQYGLMKRNARRMVPKALLSRSRKMFIQLITDHVRTNG
jgi:Domain of unknown function (DUF4133)